jgi:hypothetical protein
MIEEIRIANRGRPLGGPVWCWLNFQLLPLLAFIVLKTLANTLRVRYQGEGAVDDLVARDERFLLAFYHRRLVMMPKSYPYRRPPADLEPRGVAILSSDSKDGARSSATWRWFGIQSVYGTATHSGVQALVKLIRAVKDGWDLGIAVDGPRGPRQQVKPGILAVSRKTGAWIVPVCVAYERAWQLGTWDGLLLPHPFSAITVRYGSPYRIPAGGDEEALRLGLEQELDRMEDWAERAY